MSYHIISYNVMLRQVKSCHVVSCKNTILWCPWWVLARTHCALHCTRSLYYFPCNCNRKVTSAPIMMKEIALSRWLAANPQKLNWIVNHHVLIFPREIHSAARHDEWTYVRYQLQQYCKEFNTNFTFHINQSNHLHNRKFKKLWEKEDLFRNKFLSHEFLSSSQKTIIFTHRFSCF